MDRVGGIPGGTRRRMGDVFPLETNRSEKNQSGERAAELQERDNLGTDEDAYDKCFNFVLLFNCPCCYSNNKMGVVILSGPILTI
ncbi:unnamed protein product, partial [Linum tenue]